MDDGFKVWMIAKKGGGGGGKGDQDQARKWRQQNGRVHTGRCLGIKVRCCKCTLGRRGQDGDESAMKRALNVRVLGERLQRPELG